MTETQNTVGRKSYPLAPVDVHVMALPQARLAQAADVLARCFFDNLNFVDLFPDSGARARALIHLQRACLRDALAFGHVDVAVGSETDAGEILGVAAWLPPGAFPLSPWRQLRTGPDVGRVLAAAPRSIPRLVQFMTALGRMHPAQPHWYLEVVGVDPRVRGLGVGTRLLERGLARTDAAGEASYLETMTERNVAWYRKLGFEIEMSRVSFTPEGPPNWTMLRTPRFAAANDSKRRSDDV